jgi:phage protein U
MTFDQYNEAVKQIFTEQQNIAQMTAQLALSGTAYPSNAQFGQLMARQWSLIQQLAKLNTDMMLGIMMPKA